MSNQLDIPLTDEEYAELDQLLKAAVRPGARSMDVAALEGMLTALAIGPTAAMPSNWLSWVWDIDHGTAGTNLSTADTMRNVELILRHHRYMQTWMSKDPASFEPIYECGDEWSAENWCEGFLFGVKLDDAGWAPLMAGQPAWFAPFMRLGSADGRALTEQDGDADHWAAEVTPSVVNINAFFGKLRRRDQGGADAGALRPVMRETPKVGRNDPCSCGSGKKFKKCCAGADPAPATVH